MAFRPVGPKPQTELLLEHFRTRPNISGLEANGLFRIKSLSRRINDLESRGHSFRREQKVDSTGQRYVRYHYLGYEPTNLQHIENCLRDLESKGLVDAV